MDRRNFMAWGGLAAGAALLTRVGRASADPAASDTPPAPASVAAPGGQVSVVTPNGSTLPLEIVGGVKVGHLVAEPVEHEFAPGLRAEVWGYNGSTPGPTIEAVEGDRLRIYVTNRLPEPTTVHWHGLVLPNGMDGVAGLTQKPIPPGETYVYELTLRHAGTFMYHSHYDEMTQIALGMVGMFIVHPKRPRGPRVDRDFVLMTHEWKINAGAKRPDPNAMNDFNVLTFNGKAFPATDPLVVGRGERVRIRLGNLGPMDHHPIHLHGYTFRVAATDGGRIPAAAQWPETTVLVAVGSTRDVEFVADAPGDWAMHCHMTHHVMNQMGHDIPNMNGVEPGEVDALARRLVPGYMTMGQHGMGDMAEMGMAVPKNSIPMVGARGQYDYITMGGMFTVLKVRDELEGDGDPGWYKAPPGTIAEAATADELRRDGIKV